MGLWNLPSSTRLGLEPPDWLCSMDRQSVKSRVLPSTIAPNSSTSRPTRKGFSLAPGFLKQIQRPTTERSFVELLVRKLLRCKDIQFLEILLRHTRQTPIYGKV